jgi:hypothetical protein
MTTLKTIATTCLAASGLALAQGPGAAPAAPRTGLYTGVTKGNAAADRTVEDFSRRPTLIGDKQYFAGFGGADMGNAAFSLKGKGWNWFGEVTGPVGASGAANPDSLRLGLGSGNAWGAGVILAVNRIYGKTAAGDETTTYIDASGIGVFGDFNLGSSDVYGSVGWNTGFPTTPPAAPHNSVLTNPAAGSNTENLEHELNVTGGWRKEASGEGTHAFGVEAAYVFGSHSTSGITPSISDKVNILTIMPMWGYVLRATADYSVFVGANGMLFLANDDVAPMSGSRYAISASPNIAFQKQLGHGFEGFSGFSVTGSYAAASDEPANNAQASQLLTGGADVAVGLRWVKDNLAFEGSLKESVLANGPYLIGGNAGQGLFVNIGLALGF